METFVSLLVGLGLSAACGFRIFVPLTIMSLAAAVGWLQLPAELAWAASPLALTGLLAATVFEIGSYYVPWIDNLLDTLATPLAMMAGTLLTFGFAPELNPFMHWGLALVAGGGLAGTIQAASVGTRAASSVTTGGLGNPLLATGEALAATGLSLLSIFVPLLAMLAIAGLLIGMLLLMRKLRRRAEAPA